MASTSACLEQDTIGYRASEPVTASGLVHDLMDCLKSGAHVLNWTELCIDKDGALRLFQAIDDALKEKPVEVKGALTINLTENRMGSMDVDDLAKVLKVVKKYPWMLVRFGYDIVEPRLRKALATVGMPHEMGHRIQLYQPWRHPANVKLAGVMERMAGVMESVATSVQKSQEHLEKVRLQDTFSTLVQEYLHSGIVQGFIDAFEQEAAKGLANYLENGEVVSANYVWAAKEKNMPGDLDYCVIGKLEGEDVVVLGEAKHNMANDYQLATLQLGKNLKHWLRLCDLATTPDAGGSDALDYTRLGIKDLKSRRIALAFAGNIFPSATDQEISAELLYYTNFQSCSKLQIGAKLHRKAVSIFHG